MSWPLRIAAACSVSLALLAAAPLPARAGTFTGGATEWTQIQNGIVLLQKLFHNIQMVVQLYQHTRYWAQTVKKLGQSQDPRAILNGFRMVTGMTRGVLFASERLAQRWRAAEADSLTGSWKTTHPGRKDPSKVAGTDPEAYRRIDESIQRSVEKALRVLDAQGSASAVQNEEQVFQRLQSKVAGQGVQGQLQAAMVANELLLDIDHQLRLTRQLLQGLVNVMAEQASGDAQRRQYDDAIRARDPGYTGRYRGRGAIDLMRTP